jgi:hypothetical protein
MDQQYLENGLHSILKKTKQNKEDEALTMSQRQIDMPSITNNVQTNQSIRCAVVWPKEKMSKGKISKGKM